MCLLAHHQLLTMHVCSVDKRTDTGPYKVVDMINQIATSKTYECKELIPILDAYNKAQLDKGCTADKLRDAIRSRLARDASDAREDQAVAATRDANGSKNVDRSAKMWPIFGRE